MDVVCLLQVPNSEMGRVCLLSETLVFGGRLCLIWHFQKDIPNSKPSSLLGFLDAPNDLCPHLNSSTRDAGGHITHELVVISSQLTTLHLVAIKPAQVLEVSKSRQTNHHPVLADHYDGGFGGGTMDIHTTRACNCLRILTGTDSSLRYVNS